MPKPKIYLDTSVISAYFDSRKPNRQTVTQKWFRNDLENFTLYASTLVVNEIDAHPDESAVKRDWLRSKSYPSKIWEGLNMRVYKNEYTKKEDVALWQLHEIRNQIARAGLQCERLNHSAHAIIRRYKLSGLKLIPSSRTSQAKKS